MQHQFGQVPGFVISRCPFEVLLVLEFQTIFEAASAEKGVKRWSRAKKEALIRGDFELLKKLSECRNVTHHLIQKSLGKVSSR